MSAEAQCWVAHVRLAVVALAISPVQAGRYHGVTEAERGTLEHVSDARVCGRVVAFVLGQFLTQERWHVLVHDYVLGEKKQYGVRDFQVLKT